MTPGLRLLSVCVVAGLYGAASAAHSETVDLLRPTIADDEEQTDPVEQPVVAPSLTIAPEEEQVPLKSIKQVRDLYAAQGVRLGVIALYPSLEAGTLHTSNVANASTDAQSDIGLYLKPSLRFESDWIRHSWAGQATGDLISYLKNHIFNSQQADTDTKLRLDIRHTTRAEFEAGYNLDQTGTEKSEINTVNGVPPAHTLNASAAIIQEFDPVEGQLKLGIERQIYDDTALSGGGNEDNSDRNNYTPLATLRLSYSDTPALKPFVELTYAPSFRDEKMDRFGLRRNSQGLTASAGVSIDRGPLWSGEAALVYSVRNYADPTLATNDVFGINGNLAWRPTELTLVLLTLLTTLNETASATSSGSKTYLSRVEVIHALRENVKFHAELGFELDKGSGETNKTIDSKLGVEWQLNSNMAWTAGYEGLWFRGATSSENYNDQRLMTGIVLRR